METHGEIIKLIRHRGFGFIKIEDQEQDIFFHHSNILNAYFDELNEGNSVIFSLIETQKGLEAVDISIDRSKPNVDEIESVYNELS